MGNVKKANLHDFVDWFYKFERDDTTFLVRFPLYTTTGLLHDQDVAVYHTLKLSGTVTCTVNRMINVEQPRVAVGHVSTSLTLD
jgi:hypothetical protein